MKWEHQFLTKQGRLGLYNAWVIQRTAEGYLQEKQEYQVLERREMLADWLRWCIGAGHCDPEGRLPPYEALATMPFDLEMQHVTSVINQLRRERFLPARKERSDAKQSRWTPRDRFCLSYIGHMHALRYDQLQRLLGEASQTDPLSLSYTSKIFTRWKKAKYARYERTLYEQPGWVSLTRRGVRFVGLPFRGDAPSPLFFNHLYWITEVRMNLEQTRPNMQWISERSLQVGKSLRMAGQRRQHLPDGIVLDVREDGTPITIEIEVQISRTTKDWIKKVMGAEESWIVAHTPLRYYVNKVTQEGVRTAYAELLESMGPIRPSIEIIDLETLHKNGPISL